MTRYDIYFDMEYDEKTLNHLGSEQNTVNKPMSIGTIWRRRVSQSAPCKLSTCRQTVFIIYLIAA